MPPIAQALCHYVTTIILATWAKTNWNPVEVEEEWSKS